MEVKEVNAFRGPGSEFRVTGSERSGKMKDKSVIKLLDKNVIKYKIQQDPKAPLSGGLKGYNY